MDHFWYVLMLVGFAAILGLGEYYLLINDHQKQPATVKVCSDAPAAPPVVPLPKKHRKYSTTWSMQRHYQHVATGQEPLRHTGKQGISRGRKFKAGAKKAHRTSRR